MAASTIVPVRVPPATKEAWEAAARREGSSLSAWMRDALNTAATVKAPKRPAGRGRAATKGQPLERKGRVAKCVHGRGPDDYCSRCDA